MSMIEICARRGKWFGACRFEPRYDVGPPSLKSVGAGWFTDEILDLVEISKRKTYVADVCVTCGRVVKREQAS